MIPSDIYRWSREDYERMVTTGVLPPETRVELIDGIIYDKPPQSGPRVTGLHLALDALRSALPDAYLRVQSPLSLGEGSQPEPDIAVVPGSPRDYSTALPTTALLVVEIADASLLYDRNRKISLYARAGIPEYWLLDLKGRVLEVYREPLESGYRTRIVLREGEVVSPFSWPGAILPVVDLLP